MTEVRDETGTAVTVRRLSLVDAPEQQRVRRWVRGQLSGEVDVHTLVDVLLVVEELVANALQHTAGALELRVVRSDAGVHVEVADRDPRPPRQTGPSGGAWGGRGVQVLEELTTAWGVRSEAGGKVVWALLPVMGAPFAPRSR
ncbi:ATP-binding protein [Umezawaea beigongshangensis]|uniref:ATP-binding protein n=1 Tax=Umezawaea beigongshangensis TaxID=2780383 RepID=UPI0018F17788|nr:ATP-binding protein [Umezawaea beigongshangensis]